MQIAVRKTKSLRPLRVSEIDDLLHIISYYGKTHQTPLTETLQALKAHKEIPRLPLLIDHQYTNIGLHIEKPTSSSSFALSITNPEKPYAEVRLAKQMKLDIGLKSCGVSITAKSNNGHAEIPEALFLAIDWAINPDKERRPIEALLSQAIFKEKHSYSSIRITPRNPKLNVFVRFNGDSSVAKISDTQDGWRILEWVPKTITTHEDNENMGAVKVDVCPREYPCYSEDIKLSAMELSDNIEKAVCDVIRVMRPNSVLQQASKSKKIFTA